MAYVEETQQGGKLAGGCEKGFDECQGAGRGTPLDENVIK